MAKIRVFELARDLNMTTKELLGKLEEMHIEVASHMSSIEDDTVTQVKETLFGAKAPNVEETRIRPTVIRRRRKLAAEETEAPEPEALQEASAAESPAPQVPSASPPAPQEPVTAQEPVAPKKPKTEAPAKVIRRPEPPAEVSETLETPERPETPAPPAAEETPPPTAPPVEEPAAPPLDQVTTEAPETAETAETESAQETATEKAKKAKDKKKAKKDTPAKIIQLPKHPVAATPSADRLAADTTRPVPAGDNDTAAPGTSQEAGAAGKERKKGKRFKKEGEGEADNKFFKKKIAFRRKEIIEGDALYAGQRAGKGRKKGKAKPVGQKPQITVAKAIKRRIKIDDTIVLSDLAKRMGIKAGDMIKTLMGMGVMATVNQTIDFETAVLVASEFGYEVERARFEEETIINVAQEDDPELMAGRPPVVTIMGHVDHGKTSLLDVIRKTRITDQEAGGITQHIGAYHVTTDKGQIVFLDTPGHEAFTAMRARGAKVTDLVVLVVAADDGVMPQTIEAINHAKASGVPILVAVNKIDKANAEPDRVVRQLSEHGLVPEDWGGDTIFVKVSAKQNEGIDDLLEMILLQAEVLDIKANPDRLATGYVVEAKLDAGRGPVATILIQRGTLRAGDTVVCGIHYGKVRAMLDDVGRQVTSAGPSIPVEVIGLSGVPVAGDELVALKDEKNAKQISEHRLQKHRASELAKNSRMSLEKLFEKMKVGEVKDLNIIIKADVDGSIEALKDSLVKLSNEEVKISVIHAATGTITESDVSLAAVSNAIIIGFNVRPNAKVAELAQEEHVDMRFHNVIYDVIKEMKDAIVGMMASTFEERLLGRAEVREVFHVPKIGAIAGSYVTDGKLERNKQVRLLRDGVIQYTGTVSSLRRFKDDVKEVQTGYECGIGVSNYNDIKVGDILECFYMEEIRPEFG